LQAARNYQGELAPVKGALSYAAHADIELLPKPTVCGLKLFLPANQQAQAPADTIQAWRTIEENCSDAAVHFKDAAAAKNELTEIIASSAQDLSAVFAGSAYTPLLNVLGVDYSVQVPGPEMVAEALLGLKGDPSKINADTRLGLGRLAQAWDVCAAKRGEALMAKSTYDREVSAISAIVGGGDLEACLALTKTAIEGFSSRSGITEELRSVAEMCRRNAKLLENAASAQGLDSDAGRARIRETMREAVKKDGIDTLEHFRNWFYKIQGDTSNVSQVCKEFGAYQGTVALMDVATEMFKAEANESPHTASQSQAHALAVLKNIRGHANELCLSELKTSPSMQEALAEALAVQAEKNLALNFGSSIADYRERAPKGEERLWRSDKCREVVQKLTGGELTAEILAALYPQGARQPNEVAADNSVLTALPDDSAYDQRVPYVAEKELQAIATSIKDWVRSWEELNKREAKVLSAGWWKKTFGHDALRRERYEIERERSVLTGTPAADIIGMARSLCAQYGSFVSWVAIARQDALSTLAELNKNAAEQVRRFPNARGRPISALVLAKLTRAGSLAESLKGVFGTLPYSMRASELEAKLKLVLDAQKLELSAPAVLAKEALSAMGFDASRVVDIRARLRRDGRYQQQGLFDSWDAKPAGFSAQT
jgi:hypothetical protein